MAPSTSTAAPGDGIIYKATYSSVPVYEVNNIPFNLFHKVLNSN